MQCLMELANHGQRQRTAPVYDFSDTPARPDQWLEIFACKVHLFHSELDRFDL
jgi:hypothetical protein